MEPSGDTLVRLAKALKVSPEQLIGGEESPVRTRRPEDLDADELLELFRQLSPTNKAAVLATARALTDVEIPAPRHPHPRKAQLKQQQ